MLEKIKHAIFIPKYWAPSNKTHSAKLLFWAFTSRFSDYRECIFSLVIRVREICRTRQICPSNFENVRQGSKNFSVLCGHALWTLAMYGSRNRPPQTFHPYFLLYHLSIIWSTLFTSMERWAKRLFVGFWKDGLLAELQARMSRSCRFLLFLPHN